MGMLVLAGEGANALRGATFSSSPAADTLFPFSTGVADGDPGTIGAFGSLTTDPMVWADIDLFAGTGGYEVFSGSSPLGWNEADSGTGDVTQESTIIHSGSFAARFSAGSGLASIYRDALLRAGQAVFYSLAMRGDAGVGRVKLTVRNLHSGNYMNSGAWGAMANDAENQSGTSYVLHPLSFNIESVAACGGIVRPYVRFELRNDNTTTLSFADSFYLVPQITFCSIHGHNIDPRSVVELRGSTDNFSSSDVLIATLTPRQPGFYATFAAQTYRYYRLKFVGTNTGSGIIYVGEWWLGNPLTLQQPPDFPINVPMRDAQVRGASTPWGGVYSVGVGPAGRPSRGLELSFRQHSDAAVTEFIEEIYLRSSGGFPLVVVPDTNKPDVYLGKIPPDVQLQRTFLSVYDDRLVIEPMLFPLITP